MVKACTPAANPRGRLTGESSALWLLLVFLLTLPALSPLWSVTLTDSADGLLHLYRILQLDALWQDGIFWTRWLPDVGYTYGLPLFTYYAPLSYYLATPLHLLGIPLTLTLNLALAAALLSGGLGMFLFTRALLQTYAPRARPWPPSGSLAAPAALVAAVAFVYAPYVLFNALERGNLAEQWALAFAPFALWFLVRLARAPTGWNWAGAVLLAAAVVLSHNITGLLLMPLWAAFGLAQWLAALPRSRRAAFLFLSAGAAALALSAFFWLPALVERDTVQIARVIVTPDFDYRYHFVSPLDLVALLPRADTGRLNPLFPNTLGAAQVALTLLGAVALARAMRTRRALPPGILLLGGLTLVVLMLSISQPVWERMGLLAYLQLPMRLRGLVALALAPLCGLAVTVLPWRWSSIAVGVATAALVLTAFPLLYPRYAHNLPVNPTFADMMAYEARTGAFGTTSFGEYLPVWVQDIPDRAPTAVPASSGAVPNRFDIPPGVTTCGGRFNRATQTVCVAAPVGWRVVFRAFYVPGFTVRVDGMEVAARPTAPQGLITFDVPAGEHRLTVTYEGTPLERAAEGISLLTALVVVGAGGLAFARRPTIFPLSSQERGAERVREGYTYILPALGALALALLAFKLLYTDRVSNPFVARFDGRRVEGISAPRQVNFGEIEWLGLNASPSPIKRGSSFTADLYWRAPQPLTRNLSTFVHLTTPDGFVLAQQDNLHPANLPTTRWDTDGYVQDRHEFVIPSSLAPGEYELRAGVYDPSTNARLKTPDGADYILLGTLRVTE